ncbi:MAG: tRNA epoxyqueuosine(34) reductase QueG [Planctomycetes bacterium GWF2_41_51]|nr:MAG: tRNA epoxyqueuosine(34) reductase QueG [Planctomycetes bacterium GWF2_41_51]HBG25762.1 tRNA epoxyqueuosine(34) reductase QueG [Phycisphaerales bacterium]
MRIEDQIKRKALSLGFDLAGITSAQNVDSEQIEKFNSWLKAGCNGQMAFLERNPERRFNPAAVLPGAKSIICVAINYKIQKPASKDCLQIASYALYPDYHKFIKEKLSLLADFLKSIDKNLKFKICVDSSSVAEKALAMRSGLGFIAKNRLLTNNQFGSFLLLGEIITNMQLEPDKPVERQECGKCRKCVDVCPTGALTENNFDARKCVSYLTIEHKGRILPELKNKIGLHLFGCEECLKVCPFNEKSPIAEKSKYGFTAKQPKLTVAEVCLWSKKDFENFAANTAIQRTGFRKIKRNALICRVLREHP